jgi:branched-chain amino acid transport system permease protein
MQMGHIPARWSDRAGALWWAAAAASFFLFPDYRAFGASVLVMALFGLSLGLSLGFAGIVSLGHAVYFGIGAYAAGRLALGGWQEPISVVLVAGLFSGLVAVGVGFAILRLSGLPLLMVTLALGVIAFEAANKATGLTGGDDGLVGISFEPVLGIFQWRLDGTVQFIYSLAWLAIVFLIARRLVGSPFGLSMAGVRENPQRMQLLGAPVLRRLVVMYAISGCIAGIAGALLTQNTAFVGLQVLSIETSVDVLVMVVLGGVFSIYGGLLGAPVYMIVKYVTQQWNPFYWMLVIGVLLMGVTFFLKGGIAAWMVDVFRSRRPADR